MAAAIFLNGNILQNHEHERLAEGYLSPMQCKHYQKYLDEYCLTTSRRNIAQGISKAIMLRVVQIKNRHSNRLLPMRR